MSKKKADKKKGGFVRAIRNIFVFLIACALLILLGLTGIYIYVKHDVNPRLLKEEDATALSDVDCIIILGASVKNGDTPSPMLRDRLDEGIALYKAGCAPKILMSGDHGSEYYNEVSVMKNYAIKQGVPSEDIFLDHAGFSTYESMYRARAIFGAEKVVIVTQKYHLTRAVYNAKNLGMDAYGVAAAPINYGGQTIRNIREYLAYFIMGRSVNSRNRVFTETEDGIRTEAADPSKLTDPHLIIYAPVRVLGNKTIVTNGDQTDTIYELMDKQQTFEQSLRTREYEDDAPNYTPRISGIMHVENGSYNYAMSILKSADGNPDCCERFTFSYTNPLPGTGHFIHTYMGDGNPLPSFEGEPKLVAIPDDMDAFTDMLWNSLNEDNKVSLFVRYIDIETGKATSKIINKYDRV